MNRGDFSQQAADYHRIEKAIRFLEDNFKSRPSLDRIARSVHLSKYHFNRLFKRWAGISPVRFLQFLSLEYIKEKLARSQSLLEVALDAGLSGPGRLHDLFVTFDAMTPGKFKRGGCGATIRYGFCDSPFGGCLLAMTDRGICHLGFTARTDRSAALNELMLAWPGAVFVEDSAPIASTIRRIFGARVTGDARPFFVLVKGTNFQVNVWRALLSIPAGSLVSYGQIAAFIGRPKAVRAVARAIAVNPVGYLLPCHRVITASGRFHAYRWGSARKKALLGWEAARAQAAPAASCDT